MKLNLLKNAALFATFWLNLECKPTDKLACEDGSCCDNGNKSLEYITHLDSVRADFGAYGFFFKDSIQLPMGREKVGHLGICPNDQQLTKTLNLVDNLGYDEIKNRGYFIDSTRHYKYPYALWATVYHDRSVFLFTDSKYLIHIERVVEVK